MQVPQINRDVLRFDIRGLHVNDIEMFTESDDIARVLQRARALAAVQVGNMWGSAHANKRDMLTPKSNVGLGCCPMHHELARCRIKRRFDEHTIDLDHL